MRVVVQRVHRAVCRVGEENSGSIDRGLLVFLGVGDGDGKEDVDYLAQKISGLRVFADEEGRMEKNVADVDGGMLIIPQFTLYGDVSRGLRPSFDRAASPGRAEELYELFLKKIKEIHTPVASGKFGAMMDIQADNDGPVTVLIDSNGEF
ncbi:MAG: D-aminoacyl-tRNA deacylase [bacterium]